MKNKKFIFISLLILAIGFAAVSTTLYISGNLVFGTNKNDFDIYFNKAILDDVDIYEDVISEDKRTITFTTKNLKTIGDKSILEYQVMNNSLGYDAKVEVNCNLSDNKYVSYTNTLNDTILAQTVEDGVLTVTLDKVSTEEVEETITCSLVYKATERTSKAELYDENTYVLSGYLQDAEGNALTNQNIVVYSETPHIVTTNSLGYFYVENLLNEKHEIYITNKTVNELEGMTKTEVIESSISKGTFKVTNDTIILDNNYKLDKEKITISDNFDKTCANLVGTIYNYDYTGGEQTLEIPCNGTYKLETWGASGGNYPINSKYNGGYGAYAKGNIKINKDIIMYINVGGRGEDASNQAHNGGYNGGGSTTSNPNYWERSSSGGGATHMALFSGELYELSDHANDNSIYIVAGGGAGGGMNDAYGGDGTNGDIDRCNLISKGHAGGIVGNTGEIFCKTTWRSDLTDYSVVAKGGNQEMGGTGLATNIDKGVSNTYTSQAALFGKGYDGVYSGGGGGYYGGGSISLLAGGGSSYIGNSTLTNKAMYCYNCTPSSVESTKTISTTCTSATPTPNCAKQGNGYAKITLVSID